jgi:hypothetical protein
VVELETDSAGTKSQVTIGTRYAPGYLVGGIASFVNGDSCIASANFSHAEGTYSVADGAYSHAEGDHAVAHNGYEHAEGVYNVSHSGTDGNWSLWSVGCGKAGGGRANGIEMTLNGKIWVKGVGGFDGTNAGAAGIMDLATFLNSL